MNILSKVQMDLIERAARAVFPDFEYVDVQGGEVVIYKTSGESERFNPLANLVDAISLAESLDVEFSGQGVSWASAKAYIESNTIISEICWSNDDLVENNSCQPLCVAITRCAAMVWELKKCKQSQ